MHTIKDYAYSQRLYLAQWLKQVAETGFSHRLTAYKIVGHFFGLSYLKISGHNQHRNIFFRISNISAPCPHAQLRGRTVIKKLWQFFGPWGRDLSQSLPCWIFQVKQTHQSTASERTTRLSKTMHTSWKSTPPSFSCHSVSPTLNDGTLSPSDSGVQKKLFPKWVSFILPFVSSWQLVDFVIHATSTHSL